MFSRIFGRLILRSRSQKIFSNYDAFNNFYYDPNKIINCSVSLQRYCTHLTINNEITRNNCEIRKSEKFQLSYTCLKCNSRNVKIISKVAYHKGVIIVKCDGCQNNHLIADNLNWFTDLNGKKNIEDILREKGESILKITSEDLEIIAKEMVTGKNI